MFFSSSKKIYSFRKSRHILKNAYSWYKKKRSSLSQDQLTFLETKLASLDQALLNQQKEQASDLAKEVEKFGENHFKKSFSDYAAELFFAITFALIAATIIRAMWFEPYEIPSGSMRPTFEEQDRLTVTKTAFGINIPLMTDHFYFDPNLVQRLSVFIWSGDGIPHLDSTATFMGIPYAKRYIKRCMGKPGDTLYFYGGKIFGIDEQGNDIVELRDNPWMTKLENTPFIHFEGRVSYNQDPTRPASSQVLFHQFNQLIGRLLYTRGQFKGEIFNGKDWIKDDAESAKNEHWTPKTYSDFFGMRNFAMARLLTKKQASEALYDLEKLDEGKLYLELRHHPSLSYPNPLIERYGIFLAGFTTLIPLQEKHLIALMDNMYTARFVIKNGRAARYQQEGSPNFTQNSPNFPGVPDGTYEFYYGIAYKIDWGGIPFKLDKDHPLYNPTPEHIQKLYNMGIEISNMFDPSTKNMALFPNRYAYFNNEDLYLLGAAILKKSDPTLIKFNELEKKKEETGTSTRPYVAFKDYGPPLKSNGKLDKDFIKAFGYKLPPKTYLALGDNHAMSQDSRHFGPIPQANLQGAPSLIIWPPGDRLGAPNQNPYPLITLPRLIVWGIFGLILLIWYIIHKRNLKKPVYKKLAINY